MGSRLLLLFGLPTLESRRKILKLCYLAGTLKGAIHCTHSPLQIREMDSRLRSYSTSTLVLPFARTRSYQHSFFPHAMKLWNDLPPDTNSCPLEKHFRNLLLFHFVSLGISLQLTATVVSLLAKLKKKLDSFSYMT